MFPKSQLLRFETPGKKSCWSSRIKGLLIGGCSFLPPSCRSYFKGEIVISYLIMLMMMPSSECANFLIGKEPPPSTAPRTALAPLPRFPDQPPSLPLYKRTLFSQPLPLPLSTHTTTFSVFAFPSINQNNLQHQHQSSFISIIHTSTQGQINS